MYANTIYHKTNLCTWRIMQFIICTPWGGLVRVLDVIIESLIEQIVLVQVQMTDCSMNQ